MYAIKALYDGTSFKPLQPIPVTGGYEVVITFVEPVNNEAHKSTAGKLPRTAGKGLLKGKLWMSEDFNAPLEDMKEYME